MANFIYRNCSKKNVIQLLCFIVLITAMRSLLLTYVYNSPTPTYTSNVFWDGLPENESLAADIYFDLADNKSAATILEFTQWMRTLDMEAVLIEPRVLYRLLDEQHQTMLRRKHFRLLPLAGSPKVLTFAIFADQVGNLDRLSHDKSSMFTFRKYNITPEERGWILNQNKTQTQAGHIFFKRKTTIIHGVVFHKRGSYVWHSSLPQLVPDVSTYGDVIFKYASAYEWFSLGSVRVNFTVSGVIFVPLNTFLFLMEIRHSRFIECNPVKKLPAPEGKLKTKYERLKAAFIQSNLEFKTQLHPKLKLFFIFDGTLLGWYRHCDIIPYTTDVDFAAWSEDIGSEEFWIETFFNKSSLKLREIMGLPEVGYELMFRTKNSRVDLFFVYKYEDRYSSYGHRPSKAYYFSYDFPKFHLCSGDLLGHKVHIPCEALQVIVAEYGSKWAESISAWDYEGSPKNTGPRHYWSKDQRPFAHKALP